VRKLVSLSFLLIICTCLLAQEYAIAKIPAHLLKNADAVLRLEELHFEFINTGKAVYKNHYVITILNENGDRWAEFSEQYDKLSKINDVDGVLYDANGRQIKKMKQKDMQDMSGVSDGTLMDDNRYKLHNFYHKIYPYTVEYTVEMHYNSTLFFPMWSPQGSERLSVQQSSMAITTPADYNFRFKSFNYTGQPVVTQEKNNKTTTWLAKDMPAIQKEIYGPLWHEMTTVVIFGPTDFQIEEYKGNMMTWLDFGKFQYSLNQGKDVLPDAVKQEVHRLVDGISDPKQKITILYEYLQKHTRYISIQLGIGGWQPFDAKFVAAKAYGDCKALTNYMHSLLKEAGISSNCALIRAGSNAGYITDEFPSQQFNHVILSVPLQQDTVWLECTSQTLPAGYLSDFTSNRFALLVDEKGGHLVRTPKYGIADNIQLRNVKAELSEDATLHIKTTTRYGAQQQDQLHGLINSLSKEKVKEYLHEQLDFATYDVNDFDYKEHKALLPVIDEKLDITASNYATITGKRLFIQPNIMTRSYQKLRTDTERKYDVVLNLEYRDIDTVEINLPAGYEPEALPRDVTISSQFGKYNCSVKLNGNKLLYCRSNEQYSGRFPATQYGDLVKYYEEVYRADRNRVVLVKK
jgi:hypothetical protein